MDRATETVALKDGRQVVVQELTAMDSMIAKRILNAKSPADLMALPEVMVCCSIASIDGKKFDRPTNLVGVQALMGTVKARDYARLERAYKRLNEDDDEGEAVATDPQ